ncbi:hypothetical protein, partial [Microvirga aerophila]|uniref:hypothetical protein n=1 Tax=Microvirga aerophila TaxID=670291 RepID=UPI001AEDCA5A
LRHRVWLLTNKGCLKGVVNGFLTRLKAAAPDGTVDRCPNKLRHPNVHLPVSPFPTSFPEPLNALDPFRVRHGIPPTALQTVTRNARF